MSRNFVINFSIALIYDLANKTKELNYFVKP